MLLPIWIKFDIITKNNSTICILIKYLEITLKIIAAELFHIFPPHLRKNIESYINLQHNSVSHLKYMWQTIFMPIHSYIFHTFYSTWGTYINYCMKNSDVPHPHYQHLRHVRCMHVCINSRFIRSNFTLLSWMIYNLCTSLSKITHVFEKRHLIV